MVKDKSAKYLVYVDILGFDELAKKEAKKTERMTSEEIKKSFTERVQSRINSLKFAKEIERGEKQSQDSWLLFTDELTKAFQSIAQQCKEHVENKAAQKLRLQSAQSQL